MNIAFSYIRQSARRNARLALCFLCLSTPVVQAEEVSVNGIVGPIGDYVSGLLELSFSRLENNYSLVVLKDRYPQARMIVEMKKNNIDIGWFIHNPRMAKGYSPIEIGILKGLLGKRVLLIKKENREKFLKINTCDELSLLTFGQGEGWPDARILTHNGYRVVTGKKYATLFSMLEAGRFDAFPRGVFEPWNELITHKDKSLIVEERFLFDYPMPVYLYVSNKNRKLASTIERGLRLAIKDGSFDRYFDNFSYVKQMKGNMDLASRVRCSFVNPDSPTIKQ